VCDHAPWFAAGAGCLHLQLLRGTLLLLLLSCTGSADDSWVLLHHRGGMLLLLLLLLLLLPGACYCGCWCRRLRPRLWQLGGDHCPPHSGCGAQPP
jgi:hypothetical protein